VAMRQSFGCHSSMNSRKNSGVLTRPVNTGRP
jgi:hypothetical protein